MNIVFLTVSAGMLLLACNLFGAIKRGGLGGLLCFAFAMLVGSMSAYFVILQFLVLAIFASAEAVRGIVGIAACLLFAVSILLVLIHCRQGFKSESVIDRALSEVLGSDFSQFCRQPGLPASPIPAHSSLSKPFALRRPDVVRTRDIEYANEGGVSLLLDVYKNANGSSNSAPVLLQIHGGGWLTRMGTKNEQALPLMNHMAAQGWVCVSLEYRASPDYAFPTHIIDCKRALAWVKRHITEYGGDPDFVVATGGSAGGQLCALLALSANDPAYQPGFEEVDTGVQGCVPLYGVLDFANDLALKMQSRVLSFLVEDVAQRPEAEALPLIQRGSPLRRIHADAPPFLVVHGSNDSLTSVEMARHFSRELASVSCEPVVYAELKWVQHGFDALNTPTGRGTVLGIEKFLSFLYGRYLQGDSGHRDHAEPSLGRGYCKE